MPRERVPLESSHLWYPELMISAFFQETLEGVTSGVGHTLPPLWQLELVIPGKWQRGQQPAEPLLSSQEAIVMGQPLELEWNILREFRLKIMGWIYLKANILWSNTLKIILWHPLKTERSFRPPLVRPSLFQFFFFCMGYAVIFGCCDLKYLRHSFTSCIFFYLSHNTQSLCIKIVYWSDV